MRSKKAGFTVIELLVVVAILGVLSVLAEFQYSNWIQKTKIASTKVHLSNIYSAEQLYQTEFQSYSTRFDQLGLHLEGKLYFDMGFGTDFNNVPSGAPAGLATCNHLCGGLFTVAPVCSIPILNQTNCSDTALYELDGETAVPKSGASSTQFLVNAHTHFGGVQSGAYTITIDQNKNIVEYASPTAN